MSNNKSYVDLAYEELVEFYNENNEGGKSKPMPFLNLLYEVGKKLGFDENNEDEFIQLASKFYTALTVDGRFVAKENNTWVLREHEKYEDIHIDMNKIYTEDEESEEASDKEENEDGEFNDEYNDEEKLFDSDEDDEAPVTSGDTDDDDDN